MKLESPNNKWKREAILRGLYEENLRMADKKAAMTARQRHVMEAPAPPAPERPSPWLGRAGLGLVALLIVLGGFQLYRELQPEPAAATAPLSTSERMQQEFQATQPSPDPPERLVMVEGEVPIASVLGLRVNTIVIDAGHGGEDPGAIGPTGTREKDITLDVARRLRRRLERYGTFNILMTRDDDRKVSRHARVAYANDHNADLFISIHVNSFPDRNVVAIETYYFGLKADAATLQLAARENADFELSNAEFQHALEKFGKTMKFQESKHLATSIQKTLYRNIRKQNSNASNWGVKAGPFTVLLGVEVPSVLAEIAVISNAEEEARLNTPEYREQLAASLEAGILTYLQPEREPPNGLTD